MIGLVLLLGIMRIAPRIMPLLATDIASIGPQSAHTWVLLAAFVALGVTVLVPLVALIVSFLEKISLLPLIVEVSLAFIFSGLPGTLGIVVASLDWWLCL